MKRTQRSVSILDGAGQDVSKLQQLLKMTIRSFRKAAVLYMCPAVRRFLFSLLGDKD